MRESDIDSNLRRAARLPDGRYRALVSARLPGEKLLNGFKYVGTRPDDHNDVMLGSRIRSRREALNGGMPAYKYFANRGLTFWQNLVSGQNLSEWHTGMRAYRASLLRSVDFEHFSDDFVFDTQILFAIVALGARVGDFPVPVRYFPEASSIDFRRSCVYGARTMWESFKFLGRRVTGHLTAYSKDRSRA